jgi:hypothetical protein
MAHDAWGVLHGATVGRIERSAFEWDLPFQAAPVDARATHDGFLFPQLDFTRYCVNRWLSGRHLPVDDGGLHVQHTLRFKQALPTALLSGVGALAAILTACGGGGMGSDPMPMGCSGSMSGGMGGMMCPAPTIKLASPGSTVNRTVKLSAAAAAGMGAMVMRVDFMVDGTSVGMASMAPYTVSWDSTTVSDGTHTLTASVTDNMDMTATSTAVTVQVENEPGFMVSMAPAQLFPAPTSAASGTANLTAKLGTGAVGGKVMLSGVSAAAVSINEAFAGATGPTVIMLAASATIAGEWDVPAGARLTADQVSALLQGMFYVLATSAANPGGELRGQITPTNITVVFADMAGSQEVPPVVTTASGVAAVTVDSTANTLTVHANSAGVSDAMTAEVATAATGVTGPKLATLTKDSVNMGQWSMELAAITASDVSNFQAGRWYVNVATPADPSGAIRGQIDASSMPKN